jgi:hypothetical protein
MAGTDPNTDPFSGIFFQNDPNINQQLRQRIALAMLMNKRAAPKNLGEGIAALGDAFRERRIAREMGQADLADQARGRAATDRIAGASPAAAVTPYAPPADVAPAVAAIDRAIVPAPAPVDLQPAPQPSSVLFEDARAPGVNTPNQPASMLDPNAMTRPPVVAPRQQASPMDGGYNILDAQAGMKRQGTARGQAGAERAFPGNLDMQAYASQLAAGEQTRPGDTSPTGARGLYQFVPGTARQYGLANPDDDMASADALRALTGDNAATLERRLQRPPTMADLALAHQQGAGTAANMLTGTGNAPPRNLALNNVPAGAGPDAATARIKGYYGMPERPVNPRDTLAATLQQQATAGGPQVNPTPPVDAPIMAFDGSPSPSAIPLTGSPVRAAPPARPITAAPQQQQVAQAQPAVPPAGYISQLDPEPQTPAQVGMTIAEQRAREEIRKDPHNEYVTGPAKETIAAEIAKRQFVDARNLEVYKEKLKERAERVKAIELQKQGAAKAITDEEKNRAELALKTVEARIATRTGMTPAQLYERLDKEKANVDQTIKAQTAQQLARKAINDGVITGYGANMQIAQAKFADWAFKNGMKGNLAANTEIMQAALKAGLSEAVKTVNGEGGTGVSNTDVRIAEGIAGSDPQLQMKTIKAIMDQAAAINHRKINAYEAKVEAFLGGEPIELQYRSSHGPTAPGPHIKMLMDAQADPVKAAQTKTHFDEVYGPGAADLELARVERLARKKARGG